MSKSRDEDSQADMEVGMTTAERRRRRRRGGGLRVPSDNVPRQRTPTAPPPPRPEDPALAMSIAYSFANDASGPVPRGMNVEDSSPILAPDAAPTVIDPPNGSANEPQDFEMKTREMSAVDLQALGLADPSERERARTTTTSSDVDVDVSLDTDQPEQVTQQIPSLDDEDQAKRTLRMAPVADDARASRGSRRLQTVALSDEDLEEVRAATQPSYGNAPVAPSAQATQPMAPAPAATQPGPSGPQQPVTGSGPHAPVAPSPASSQPGIAPPVAPAAGASQPGIALGTPVAPLGTPPPLSAQSSGAHPPATPPVRKSHPPTPAPPVPAAAVKGRQTVDGNRTMPIAIADVEVLTKHPASEEPMSVPEIDIQELADRAESSGEIEVDIDEDKAASAAPAATATTTGKIPRAGTEPPAPPAAAKPGAAPHAPPPPPAQAKEHKAPPAPPPKKAPPAAAVAAVVTKEPSRPSRAKPWFVDLFDEDYLRTLPFLTPQATQAEAEFVIETMNLAPGAQVLDVGCGYGRHAMELAARGFHVVGLDLSTPLLVRGGEEAHRRGLTINFVRGDMRELDFENQFDAAYCLFSTFGYFDDETNKKTLQNVARALKPGGKLLVEILNRDYVIADLPTRVWWEGDGCVVLEEVELNYFSSRIQVNRSVVFDDGRQLEQEISVRAYSLHEVGKLMHAAGFRVLEVSGGYQTRGRFFGNQSRHIIVLAERKSAE